MSPELWKLSWLQVTLRYLFEITASLWHGSFFSTRKLHGVPLCRPMFRVIFRTRHGGLAVPTSVAGKVISRGIETPTYVPLNDPIWCKKMISPFLWDFYNLSWDQILGFVRVLAKKQSPGVLLGLRPLDFRLGAPSPFGKHRTKRCLFPTTNWSLNLPKAWGASSSRLLEDGCGPDVSQLTTYKDIEGKGLMKTLNTVERKVLQLLIHLVWNDRSLQKLQARSDKKIKKDSCFQVVTTIPTKIHGPWCHDSFFGPIYKGFSSFPSRAWDFAMGNLIRDWSSCQPGQMHQKKNNETSPWVMIHVARIHLWFQVHVLMYVLFFTSLQLLHTNWEHHIKEYKSADEWLPPRCWLAEFFAAANDSKTKRNTGDLQIESKNPLFFVVFHRFW